MKVNLREEGIARINFWINYDPEQMLRYKESLEDPNVYYVVGLVNTSGKSSLLNPDRGVLTPRDGKWMKFNFPFIPNSQILYHLLNPKVESRNFAIDILDLDRAEGGNTLGDIVNNFMGEKGQTFKDLYVYHSLVTRVTDYRKKQELISKYNYITSKFDNKIWPSVKEGKIVYTRNPLR